jgi:hypothetical protein
MAIERVVKRKGEVIKADPIQPGSQERLSPRGFWRTFANYLLGENQQVVTVVTPDKIKVSNVIDIRMTKIERRGIEFEKDEINKVNGEGVRTPEFGIRKKEVLYRWIQSENNPQGR